MPAGRPCEFKEEYIQRAEDYLLYECPEETDENGKIIKKGKLPKLVDLAIILGCDDETIGEWAKKNEDFSAIVTKIKQSQHSKLVDKGLNGEYNSKVTGLMLAKFGYHEHVDTDLTTQGQPIFIPGTIMAKNAIPIPPGTGTVSE